MTFEWDAAEHTWTVICDECGVVERGYYALADAEAETADHTCPDAEADWEARMDNGWSYPA